MPVNENVSLKAFKDRAFPIPYKREVMSHRSNIYTNLWCCHNITTRRLVYNGGYIQNNNR